MDRTSAALPIVTEVTRELLHGWQLPPLTGYGKDARGDVWAVGGARRTPGAVMLAGEAALRVGAGRLTLAVAESVAIAVAVAVPESGVQALAETGSGSVRGRAARGLGELLQTCDAVLVGAGLDDPGETAAFLETLVPQLDKRSVVVLDAFALGVLDQVPAAADGLAGRLVLTPNTKELERLGGERVAATDEADLPRAVATVARRFGAVVTCHNVIADASGTVWKVPGTCIGLSTSGSGDVLSGTVLGLLGRGADTAQATCWATYLHLHAGMELSRRIGSVGFLAHELLGELPVQVERISGAADDPAPGPAGC